MQPHPRASAVFECCGSIEQASTARSSRFYEASVAQLQAEMASRRVSAELPFGTTSWVVAGSGLPNVEVAGLTLVSKERVLYAATHGRSAWSLTLP